MRWEEAVDGFCALRVDRAARKGGMKGAVNEAAFVASAVAGDFFGMRLLGHVIRPLSNVMNDL